MTWESDLHSNVVFGIDKPSPSRRRSSRRLAKQKVTIAVVRAEECGFTQSALTTNFALRAGLRRLVLLFWAFPFRLFIGSKRAG